MRAIKALLAALFVLCAVPAQAALAIVQTANGSQAAGTGVPSNVVLGSAPTVGDLVVVFLNTDTTTAPTLNTASAYGQLANSITDFVYPENSFTLYRYVQNGDTVTLPVMATAGASHWSYVAYEISGVSGNIGADVAGGRPHRHDPGCCAHHNTQDHHERTIEPSFHLTIQRTQADEDSQRLPKLMETRDLRRKPQNAHPSKW